jgi:hypothetical protein
MAATRTCGSHGGPPGVLVGTVTANVVVEGTCLVNAGPAVVRGNLTVRPGSTLLAAFALDGHNPSGSGSHLRVNGNLAVQAGSTVLLGCDPQSFTCLDDPAGKNPEEAPTLSSRSQIFGNVTGRSALSIIVHNDRISGNITQTEGGGGVNCLPEGEEAFSAYEDSIVHGNITIKGMESCWLGLNRLQVHGNVRLSGNRMADPDAIEILSNTIFGELVCRENTMVWNSAEKSFGGLFPRVPMPNKVTGKRSGQCVLASPETEGGPLGPGPF